MKTRIAVCAELAAALLVLAFPAAGRAGGDHAKGAQHGSGAEHACDHPKSGVTSTAGDAAAKGQTVVIPVGGMHCGNCAERVTAALSKVEGVKYVETSLDAKQAKVVHGGKVSQKALAAAIQKAGYEPGAPKAN